MYDPKFSQKQMYDQYGSSRKTTTTNANKQFAETMKSSGGGRNMSGIGAKPPSFGGGQDNNPNRDESENKSTVAKVYEKAVDLFKSFGAKEPEALIVDGKRVYQGPAFRGYDPTTSIGNFGGEYGKKNYFLGMEKLGIPTYPRTDVSPTLPPSTINAFGVNRDNPRLNMFGVNRSFTQPPDSPELPTSPDVPANMDPLTRGLSQAMLPVPDVPTAKYKIQLGDTLSEIADATGSTVEELARINNIKEVDLIEAGTDIDIPIRTMRDKAVVNKAKSMDELKPIKMSFVAADRTDPDAKFYNSFNQEAGSSPENFIVRLAGSESSGNPDAEITNEDGRRFVGLLQFGKARLTDYKKDTKTKFTQDEFKKDLELQGDVAIWHINDIDKTIDSVIENSAFKNRDGLRAVAHLGGKTGMKKFVRSNGEYNPKDELGTSLLDYYNKFSN